MYNYIPINLNISSIFPHIFRKCYYTAIFRNPHQAKYKLCLQRAPKTYYRENSVINYSILQVHSKHLPDEDHIQLLFRLHIANYSAPFTHFHYLFLFSPSGFSCEKNLSYPNNSFYITKRLSNPGY